MFLVGIHHISGAGEDTCKKSVVEVFPIVMVADRPPEQGIHFFGNPLTVTVPYSVKQSISIPLLRAVIEPFNNCRFKNLFDFCIRNHKSSHAIRQFVLVISLARFG